MDKRKKILSLIFTFVILLGGVASYGLLSSREAVEEDLSTDVQGDRKLRVGKMATQRVRRRVPIDGRLSAFEKVRLSANVAGTLRTGSAVLKKGMFFWKGDLLFDMDDRQAVFALYAQRSALLNAITLMISDLKVDDPKAHQNWQQYLDAFEIEASVAEFPALTSQREKYFIASRNLYQLYFEIKRMEAQLEDFSIRAPISGTITQVEAFPGSRVVPGQLLAEMIGTQKYELEGAVQESDLVHVRRGQLVRLRSGSSDKSWEGRVMRLGKQIDPITQNVPVYIQVSGGQLQEGMYLEGEIEGELLSESIGLSRKLLVDQTAVYIVEDSIVRKLPLLIYQQDEEMVYAKKPESDPWLVMEDPRGLSVGQKVIPIRERLENESL